MSKGQIPSSYRPIVTAFKIFLYKDQDSITLINKAKAISAKLLELSLKNKLGETGKKNDMKREETRRSRKTGRRKHKKTEENG